MRVVHSFLLIGQSNMAGRGYLPDAHKIEGDKIRVLRNGRWQPFCRPINFDRAFSGVCLAESFAEKHSKCHDDLTGLIPCADGGTKIDQWVKGSILYDNAVNCARLAQRTSTIAGVLWHQGESDAVGGLCDVYEEKLEALFENLRKDLGLYDVPFIIGGLGDYMKVFDNGSRIEYYEKVNSVLKHYADTHAMTGYVDPTGLSWNPDLIHFSADALYEFGIRYYKVFEQLEDKNKVFEKKPFDDVVVRGELESL